MKHILQQPIWRYYDQSISAKQRSPLESFATDDTLCQLVGQLMSPPTIRTWVHEASVVLGIQDHRLPYVQQGMELLESRGYHPIVRNSGGLAVVLDEGILNISIVLSEQKESLSINDGYDVMVDLVKGLFPEVAEKIEAYEIVGSYCPGSYDLSIDGKKFAGISQRRLRQGVAVQIYLCIEGSGSQRAALIRDFYEESLQQEETKFAYPQIVPEVMASLSELIDPHLTVEAVVIRLQQLLNQWAEEVRPQSFYDEELTLYGFYLQRVFERNTKMLERK
ncbi:biotin/lipoate A/B protein ligase family protein [Lysinibacillus capsici]|uniref:Octanoyl-[GcvH]:protein N-octanoyltransferase n=1 Tax=Lysinibacillus capsici TaxID=2115968 RepID=A0A2X0XP67_9BACI|nr:MULTISPECIES: lipoate--protein ligase family protein [Lysinibacillus]AUS85276.1 lipoate--protein ligase family protein [Lysinibacillus sp. YS11]MDP1394722.1 lipoate--protein ligase family protein [Lysinibacillus capsici]MDP1415216.1 lipoate--protein ligase family protein [Lysinibacillus capsici]MDP1431085.1 lipoate--protein ligase family protein [Lysinibacillus capsici]OCX63554.1 octanoyltransferase [Lysinibacillus sp. AR18-8]